MVLRVAVRLDSSLRCEVRGGGGGQGGQGQARLQLTLRCTREEGGMGEEGVSSLTSPPPPS